VQEFQGRFPVSAKDEFVPVGNQIVERTSGSSTLKQFTGVTEWYATVQAAAALLTQSRFSEMRVKLLPILHTLCRRTQDWQLTINQIRIHP
jgi:hypothetical protein